MASSRKTQRRPQRDELPPILAVSLRSGETWSRALSTSQAAPLVGKSADALRAMIRARARGASEVVFDGVLAIRVGQQWRVRLDRRWVSVGPDAVGALPPTVPS